MKSADETTEERMMVAGFDARSLGGILLPFTTPFKSAGEVDSIAVRSNIEKWNETGVAGYVALGSTGERVHLSEGECLSVIEAARASVPASMAFIVGAGQESTHSTIGEVRRYAGAGADAVLVITPHFYRRALTPDALIAYYQGVADASPVPVLLYSMPDLTGVALPAETVARLAEHENIVGIKDSSADLINLAETLRLVTDDFAVVTGNGPLLYAALGAGARGAILAVGCVAPRLALAILQAVEAGDHLRAVALQRRLTPLARAVTTRHGIGGLKAAMDILGYRGGPPRAPLAPPGDDARREIALALEEAAVSNEKGTRDYTLAGASIK